MADAVLGRIRGEVTLDSKGFNRGISQINQQLRVAKSAFESTSAKVKAFGGTTEQVQLQAKALARQMDLQRQKVSMLQQAHQEYSQKLGTESKQAQQLATQLNKAKTALTNMQGAYQRINNQLDSTTEQQKRYNKALEQLEQKMRLQQSTFKAATAQARAFGNANDQAKVQISGLNQQIDLQRKKVSLLSLALKEAQSKYGSNSAQAREAAVRLNEARAGLSNLQGSLRQVGTQFSRQSASIKRFNQNLFGIKDDAIETGIALGVMSGAIAVAMGSSIKKAADFEAQLSSVKAITGASADEMNKYKDLALQMGKQTKYSAVESAQGIEELAKAGVTTQQIMSGGLKGALDLAAAGELELAEAAQIASTALNAFRDDNLSVSASADILAGAATSSATDIREMQFGLSQVAAVASGAGLSFKDTSTALATFAKNGLKGSDAGTSLKTMLLNLSPSTKEATAEMKKLGIITKDGQNQFYEANGEIKSFDKIAGVLQKQLKNLSSEQRTQALKTMFGTDAIRAANIAFKEGEEGVTKMSKAMSKTTAADMAKTRMDNLKGTVEELRGAFETAQIELGTAFLPVLKELTEGLKGAVEWFSNLNPTTKEAIGIFAGVSAGVLALGAAVAGIIAISNPFTLAIGGAALALGGLTAANHSLTSNMEKAKEDTMRFGSGVSEGTKKAAKGYMDLRDTALVNLAKLRVASGAEAEKIVKETVAIFAQMGDEITSALNEDKINVQKAAASLLSQVPEALKPAVEKVTDNAIKAIDTQIKRMQEADAIILKGLVEYDGVIKKMPAKLAKAYQQSLEDLEQNSRVFVQKVSDMKGYMENITAEQGKITAQGAKKWVADIQAAYKQAETAARNWGKEQKAVLEKQFANGNITKKEYDQVLKIIELGEAEKISIAKDSRAKAIKELEKSLSEEANLIDLKTGEMIKGREELYTGMIESQESILERGKEKNREYFQSLIGDADKTSKEVKKKQAELIKTYGDMGTASVEKLASIIEKGGETAQLAAQTLAIKTRDGFKIDLGDAGMVSVQTFIDGLKSGEYDARDVSIAHMNQLRSIYGSGQFTAEGIKAVETFTNGLKSKPPATIAEQMGLDLKSKMEIDLGPYGTVTAQSFAEGLSNGTYSFDAVYAYFQGQLKQGMKFDLSAEGKANIDTLLLGMQTKAIDVQNAAGLLGLDIKSKVKVDLGPEGQQTVASLLSGLQTGKIDIQTFSTGVQQLIKEGAKIDLTAAGQNTMTTQAAGMAEAKPEVLRMAKSASTGVESTLGATTDGGGGKKSGRELSAGIGSQIPAIAKMSERSSSIVKSNLGRTTDGGGGAKAGGTFVRGISSTRGQASNAASSVSSAAKNNLKVSGTYGLGNNAASGLASGIRGGKWGVISAARSIASSVWSTMKNTLAIRSPSRKTMQLGKYAALGLAKGMQANVAQVERVSDRLAMAAMPNIRPLQAPLTPGALSNAVQQITQHVTVPVTFAFNRDVFFRERSDINYLVEEVGKMLEQTDLLNNRAKGVTAFG
ncbi:phage tail tape measure protein [Hazenella sp. IB182357]|uniref:Phage tail tape measure protein n=1 Tax=Polycladospora coralii TaxID=2771432 RepID=A0A926RVD9_9BACL|nr:phage tail tape measure protein [Polycladospora coralii]MBD1373712.1 phage tail tape measure protein [Polycladospora coralii]